MEIEIRVERRGDEPAIYRVNREAFGRPGEAELVNGLREANAVTLSMVAAISEQVVGHILFSPVQVVHGEKRTEAVALGPMAVLPEYQGQGIGSGLIRAGLDELRRRGETVIFVLGHSDYYPRFGFKPTLPRGIDCQFNVPADLFMMVELSESPRPDMKGTVFYHPLFGTV